MTKRILLITAAMAALFGTRVAAADAPLRTVSAIDALARVSLVDRAWAQPAEPSAPTVLPPIAIRALDLGNDFLARYVGLASADLVGLQIDAPNHGVKLRLGGGSVHYAHLRLSGDIAIADGSARIAMRVRLGVADQTLAFRIPVLEVSPATYHQERGIEIRLPFMHRQF